MKESIRKWLSDRDGDLSTKRVLGLAAFVIAVVAGFWIGHNEAMRAFLCFAGASVGMTAFERK
ncbi:MAG: hypothetical protein LBT92_01535 [Rickettsiales bacterium]|jgi:hypothetical protein|nr:hypothetical protein [Rickettsiales bacterium]